jgi:hypothetical protein
MTSSAPYCVMRKNPSLAYTIGQSAFVASHTVNV